MTPLRQRMIEDMQVRNLARHTQRAYLQQISLFARLCCMEAAKRALAPARDQLCDTDADGLPEIAHTIERFDRNCDFGHAAGIVAGFQDISD